MIRRNTRIGRKQAQNEDELQPKILYRSIRIQNIVKTVVSLFSVFSEEKNGNKILVKLQLWELIQSMSWCSKIKAQKKKK